MEIAMSVFWTELPYPISCQCLSLQGKKVFMSRLYLDSSLSQSWKLSWTTNKNTEWIKVFSNCSKKHIIGVHIHGKAETIVATSIDSYFLFLVRIFGLNILRSGPGLVGYKVTGGVDDECKLMVMAELRFLDRIRRQQNGGVGKYSSLIISL